jgi:hypothetical protein
MPTVQCEKGHDNDPERDAWWYCQKCGRRLPGHPLPGEPASSARPEPPPAGPVPRPWNAGDNVKLMGALKAAGGLLGFLLVLLYDRWMIADMKARVTPEPKDSLNLIAAGGLGFLSLGLALRG